VEDVDALAARLSTTDLRRWMAFDRLQPVGYQGIEALIVRCTGAIRGALGCDTSLEDLKHKAPGQIQRLPTEEEIRQMTQKKQS